jgi:hypothetical protein
MTTRQIRTVPRELPNARLYLDDIKEITDILVAAYAPISERYKASGLRREKEEQNILYEFGNREGSDTEATSIDDLRAVGGKFRYFTVKVGGPFGCEMRVYNTLPPSLNVSSLPEESARATYQKIEAVFRSRVMRFRHTVEQLPSWLEWPLLLLPSLFTLALLSTHISYKAKAGVALVGFGLFFTCLRFYLEPSRVIFADYHEKSRHQSDERKGYLEKGVFLLAGAALTVLVQYIAKKWF